MDRHRAVAELADERNALRERVVELETLLKRLVEAGDQFAIDAEKPKDTSSDIVWADAVDEITRDARKLLEG